MYVCVYEESLLNVSDDLLCALQKGEMMLPSAQAIWMAARYLREHNLLSKPIVL